MSNCTESDLGRRDIIGLAVIAQTGLLSATFALVFFGLVLRNVIVQRRHPFQRHIDVYLASLFTADIFQGLFAAMDWRWAITRKVVCGAHCTIQGVVIQFGSAGVSMSTLAITIHTFCVVFFGWTPPPSKRVPVCIVSAIWLYSACVVLVGLTVHQGKGRKDSFYLPTPFWCWIYDSTPVRVICDLFWLNLTMVVSIVTYVPLFFTLRGNIVVVPNGDRWYSYKVTFVRHPNPVQRVGISSNSAQTRLAAAKMLWYPFTHLLAVTTDVARGKLMAHIGPNTPVKDIPFIPIAVTHVLYSMTGAADVLLVYFTRPNILLFGEPVPERHSCGIARPRLGSGGRSDPEDRMRFSPKSG
ncbi:hypothetical protein BOTBODRAFT_600850 [Botryobasidium botryosum FD-172 SS1]|uniref:Uncharacterized protein n=1 Tax=Botryobasidium botryosum (strain FD-172 SS1) TaxID=930990 RepID=A0A067MZ95_BOTB1|nr:hypothetical protein BOTBODRAFT_600850 [Botryobasidium botryosum FD-172 SS1]